MTGPLDDIALDRLFRTARTYSGFIDEPVSDATLRAIWDLAKWGPTSANQQPARIVWCTSDEAKARLAACMSAQNAPKVLAAPVSAIVGMDMAFYERLPETFPHTDARSWFVGNDALIAESAMRNSTLQGAYLIMAARALGLDAGPMSGFDAGRVDEAFFAGTPVKTNFVTTLGRGDPATIFGRLPRLAFEDVTRVA